MKFFNKNKLSLLVLIAFFGLVGAGLASVATVYAAPIQYTPLAPLPGITTAEASNLPKYLKAIFNLSIGLAAALSVIMITVGGFQYMSTDSMFGKEEGKHRIKQALSGLFLAMAAWLILYTVNPATVEFNFNPEPIKNNNSPTGSTTPITTVSAGRFIKYRYCTTATNGSTGSFTEILEEFPYVGGANSNFDTVLDQCNSKDPVASPVGVGHPASSACHGYRYELVFCRNFPNL